MNQPVLCIGELLIDFFSTNRDANLIDGHTFMKKAGGAPANVCAAIAKLGGEAHFCGKVGNDSFGEFLQKTLEDLHVKTEFLMKDEDHPTTMAFVSLSDDGQRDFVFHRGADAFLLAEDVSLDIFKTIKLVHFGSATALLPGPLQGTYRALFEAAIEKKCYISFDPNFRSDLWNGREAEFVKLAHDYIARCNLLKVSEEELLLLANEPHMVKAVAKLHSLGAEWIAVTLGKDGTFLSAKGNSMTIPSISIQAVDTTGAGDAFVGALLYQLAKREAPHSLSFAQWEKIVVFSNKVAAKVCEKIGAIEALPTLEEVQSI